MNISFAYFKHCLHWEKQKCSPRFVTLRRQAALTATCDEAGREAEENHHIQKLQAERCKRVEGLGWCFFELQF